MQNSNSFNVNNISEVKHFQEINREFNNRMANYRDVTSLTRLAQVQPKTKRKNAKSRPFKNRATPESNKENFPGSNFSSSSSKGSGNAIKINGLRNRMSNRSQHVNKCLTDKNEVLHVEDLMHQFQNKEFSKDMQPIAGENSTNLKKFFSQYPSLFTIDGEYVTITCYNSGGNGGGNGGGDNKSGVFSTQGAISTTTSSVHSDKKDYSFEAVIYFQNKLEQYGEAKVPIRCLLGHRSQAPFGIRQISGQNLKEFTEFLSKCPETFVIHNEYVILKKHWDSICKDTNHIEAIVNMCVNIINSQGPTSIENLFNRLVFKSKTQSLELQTQFLNTIKNSNDVKTFLKSHSDEFLVQNGVVYPVPQKSSSNVRSVSTSTPAISCSEPLAINSPTLVLTTPPSSVMSINHTVPGLPSPNLNFKSKLETQFNKETSERQLKSFIIPNNCQQPSTSRTENNYNEEKDSFCLLRAIRVVNTLKDGQNLVEELKMEKLISFAAEGINIGPIGPISLFTIGTVNGKFYVLDIQNCHDLLRSTGLKEILESPDIKKVVHDCRHISAALHYQFDILLNNVFDTQRYQRGNMTDLDMSIILLNYLHLKKYTPTLKIISRIFISSMCVKNYTIKAAHFAIVLKTAHRPEHNIKNISLAKLLRLYGSKSTDSSNKLKKDQKFWIHRPLINEMIVCAADHISTLVPDIYETMDSFLKDETSIQRMKQLCWEQINYFIQVDEVKLRKKQRKIDFEVGELKDRLSKMNCHDVLSNREIRLLRFVNLNDEERSKLEESRKISRKLRHLISDNSRHFEMNENYSENDISERQSDDENDMFFKELRLNAVEHRQNYESKAESEGSVWSLSFEDTIRQVEEFLANERMEKLQQIAPNKDEEEIVAINKCCNCNCHQKTQVATATVSCQTMSTADIVITKVYFEDKNVPKTLANIVSSNKQFS